MADLTGYATVAKLARGEIAWATDLAPVVVGAMAESLLQSSSIRKPARDYGGRIPDPMPLAVQAAMACDQIIAGNGSGDDHRIVAEYTGDLIRSKILNA